MARSCTEAYPLHSFFPLRARFVHSRLRATQDRSFRSRLRATQARSFRSLLRVAQGEEVEFRREQSAQVVHKRIEGELVQVVADSIPVEAIADHMGLARKIATEGRRQGRRMLPLRRQNASVSAGNE